MKKRFFTIAALIAAMIFATSCSKDDEPANGRDDVHIVSTPDSPESDTEIISVPFTITVNQQSNSLSKAKLVEDNNQSGGLTQVFTKGDVLVITGEGIIQPSPLYLDEKCIGSSKATFTGELKFIKKAKKIEKSVAYPIFTATLSNESKEDYNEGLSLQKPVYVVGDDVKIEELFANNGYLKAEFPYKEGETPEIELRQYTVVLEFNLDFIGAKVAVKLPGSSYYTTIPLSKGITYVAIPNGTSVKTQMIDNGAEWTIDLDKEYNSPTGSATVWYDITRKAPENSIPALFSVSNNKQVFFSKGNLQYNASADPQWRFAENQYDICHKSNDEVGNKYTNWKDKWTDLFGWGTWLSGSKPYETQNYNAESYVWNSNATSAIGEEWYTLSGSNTEFSEWFYLIKKRDGKYGEGSVDKVPGVILLPDDWTLPSGVGFKSGSTEWYNTYTKEQWAAMEANGAVFLPAAGYRYGGSVDRVGTHGYYWSSSISDNKNAWYLNSSSKYVNTDLGGVRCYGYSVRLVRAL